MRPLLRFPPPLHILVPVVALAVGLMYVLLKLLLVTEWGIERITETQLDRAQKHTQKLVEIMARDETARQRAMADQISMMENYASLNWAAVCDANGRILHSKPRDWMGKSLSEVAPPMAVELAEVAATGRTPAHIVNGRESVIAANPVPGRADAPVQFVALAERDLSKVIAGRYSYGRREALVSVGIVILSSVLLGVILYVFLRWRMRGFYRNIGLDNGGLAAPAPLSGGDEFAEISQVLGKAEHLLRDIADHLEEVVWIIAPDFKPIYISPAFEKVYLRKREEGGISADGMPDYILKEYHSIFAEAHRAVVNGAPDMHLEYRIRRGDGEVRWMEARGFAVRDASGVLLRIVGISRDITSQKDLQEEIVKASELERHSLAHDLHDDACQRLAAIKMRSETLNTSLTHEQSPHARLAGELTSQIAGTSTLLRNIARSLAPVEVDEAGLMHALHKLVQRKETIHAVPCFFEAHNPVLVTNAIVANNLYRITQEFINNAARHAHPTRIDVSLEELSDRVRLTVKNDGLPFQEAAAGLHGMGLNIIRYRANAIGATVDIRHRDDGVTGTEAECLIPLDICRTEPPGYKISARIQGMNEAPTF